MQRHMMKSKIHRATITSADLHYEGSLTLDADLMEAADLLPYEEIQVVNVNNGARFSTYVITGPRGSGVVVAGVNPPYQAKIRRSLPALTHKTVRQW